LKQSELKRRANRIVNLGDEVEDFLNELGLPEKLKEIEISKIWYECVGDSITKHTKSVEIYKSKLYIRMEDAVWRFELTLRKEEILKIFNQNIQKIKPGKKIREIIFK